MPQLIPWSLAFKPNPSLHSYIFKCCLFFEGLILMPTLSWRLLCLSYPKFNKYLNTYRLLLAWHHSPITLPGEMHWFYLGDACSVEGTITQNAPPRREMWHSLGQSGAVPLASTSPSSSSSLQFDSWVIQAWKMAGAHTCPEESIHYFCSQRPEATLLRLLPGLFELSFDFMKNFVSVQWTFVKLATSSFY